MNILHIERDDARLVIARRVTAVKLHKRQFTQLRQRIREEIPLNSLDAVKSHLFKIVNRRNQPRRTADVLRARLELRGKFGIRGFLLAHIVDHIPTEEERRHCIEYVIFAVEDTDPHRRKHLVSRECEEVRVHRLHIHRNVRHALRAVHDDDRPDRMGAVGNRTYIVDETEHIRYMCHGDNLRLFRDLLRDIRRREVPVLRKVDVLQHRTARLCNELPRHDVAVMLRDRDDDLIALADIRTPIAVRDEVQCLRRILREDDLLGTRRADELLRPYTRRLIDIRRLYRKLVCTPMRIRVAVGAVVGDRLDDSLRFLRRGTVIKIDDGTTVHLRLQDREIL